MYRTVKGRRIRVGLVGCGRISAQHLAAVGAHAADMALVAICDNDPQALSDVGSRTPGNRHANLNEMLAQEALDALAICTPSGLHAPQAIMAARAGIHVITEKPMATRWNDALDMIGACEAAGVRLFVVKQKRRSITLQLLKRALAEKRFGKIYMVSINVFWTRPQDYYDSAPWRGTWPLDGGALMNQASHYVDLMNWLIGPVAEVQAMTGTLGTDIEAEDTGVLNIRWRSGTLGSMSVTMLTYPRNLEGSITILGEKGSVRVGGVAANQIEHWVFDDRRDYDEQMKDAQRQEAADKPAGHRQYYGNVIDVLRGQAEPETDGREGLKSLEVLMAAYLSARTARTVCLPLEL